MRKTLSLALLVTPFVLLSACHDTHKNSVDNAAVNSSAMDDSAATNSAADNMATTGDSAGGNSDAMPTGNQADDNLGVNGSNGGRH